MLPLERMRKRGALERQIVGFLERKKRNGESRASKLLSYQTEGDFLVLKSFENYCRVQK